MARSGTPIAALLQPFADIAAGSGPDRDAAWIAAAGNVEAISFPILAWIAGLPTPATPLSFTAVEPWLCKDPGIQPAATRSWLSRFADGTTGLIPHDQGVFRTEVIGALRAAMFGPHLTSKQCVERAGFDGFLPVTRRWSTDLDPLEGLLGDIDGVWTAGPRALEVDRLHALTFPVGSTWSPATRDALGVLLTALESEATPGGSAAFAAVEAADTAALDGKPMAPIDLLMPHPFAAAVRPALGTFLTATSASETPRNVALTLVRPPTAGEPPPVPELRALDAIVRPVAAAAADTILDMAKEQILGPGRDLVLTAHRGFALPLRHPVPRIV